MAINIKDPKTVKTIIMLAILLGVVGICYSIFFRRDFTHISDREVEARKEMSTIVDLMLKQDGAEFDLVKINYRPTGTLKNAYGFLRLCHPKSRNLNVFEMPDLPDANQVIKLHSSLIRSRDDIVGFFSASACLSPGVVLVYAVFPTRDGHIAGWHMDLNKVMSSFSPL